MKKKNAIKMEVRAKKENLFIRHLWFPQVQSIRQDVGRGAMRRLRSRIAPAFFKDRKTEIYDDENQSYVEIAAPL